MFIFMLYLNGLQSMEQKWVRLISNNTVLYLSITSSVDVFEPQQKKQLGNAFLIFLVIEVKDFLLLYMQLI